MGQKIGLATLNLLLAFAVVVTVLFYGPLLESKVFPVVKDFEVEAVRRDGEKVWVSGSLDKVRACSFVQLTAYAAQGTDEWIPIQVYFPDSTRVGTRAAIKQSWGPWSFRLPNPDAAAVVMFVGIHNCHSLYTTSSVLTVFEVPL